MSELIYGTNLVAAAINSGKNVKNFRIYDNKYIIKLAD